MGDVGYIETWRHVRVPRHLSLLMYVVSLFIMYGFQMLVDPNGFDKDMEQTWLMFFVRLFVLVFTWRTLESLYKQTVFEKEKKEERLKRLKKND